MQPILGSSRLFFVNGEIKEKFVGLRSKKDYQSVLDKFVG